MNFGVREICDVVFKARTDGVRIGNRVFKKNQPVLYITTAKTSSLEGAVTTVYAQGGKGNPRLIAWDGERTMTFTVEDALISPISLAMLTGAGLKNVIDADNSGKNYIYQPVQFDLPILAGEDGEGVVRLDYDTAADAHDIYYSANKGQIFGTVLDNAGAGVYFLSLSSDDGIALYNNQGLVTAVGECVDGDTDAGHVFTIPSDNGSYLELKFVDAKKYIGNTLRVDCYCQRSSGATQLTIDAENFAGDFYVEASTLFRDQYSQKDMPAVFIIPDAKIQSNFTFNMANSGDPSSFTFTMDAFPDYLKFDRSKKVLCAIQIVGSENVIPEGESAEDDTCEDIDPAILVEVDSTATDFAKAGRNLEVQAARGNFDFFGTLNALANWNTYKTAVRTYLGLETEDDAANEAVAAELTGHYFPIEIKGEDGKTTFAGTISYVSPKTGKTLTSSDGKMWIAVDSDSPVYTVSAKNGDKTATYTFDFSKCVCK